ncbi:hypothetical protein SAMN02910353_02037 [Ruminococcus sp. YRD2003]|uniref:hypothetical protein n=1 Tax=Ruminococcus sp. YRD2003 TaxID=1452313 RepID=UPI0008D03EF5|nr:hypothetical protein SAMN02910353_02037 [Ruminococcus flavefaciens]
MDKRIPQQMKIAYALVFLPVAILVLWCIYAAIFGYNYDFISSLGNSKLYYGSDGINAVLDAFVMCLILTPPMWISAVIWAIASLHLAARTISYIKTRDFDMSQRSQDIFTVAVVIMNVFFIFGILRVL